jgi:Phage Mu protein F like protein
MADRSLTSPGRATAERARLERDALAVLLPAFATFMAEVERAAVAALSAPTMLAAATPRPNLNEAFTLGKVSESWGTAAHAIEVWAREFLAPGQTLDTLIYTDTAMHQYLLGMQERLANAPLQADVFASVRDVLAQASQSQWSKDQTVTEIRKVLDLDTGAGVRTAADKVETHGSSLRKRLVQMIRTEVTAAYNVRKMSRMASGGYHFKRWVAHHDRRTRPTHLSVSGTTIPQSQDFIVGGAAMAYPGDPKGPTKETANCRCVLVGAREPTPGALPE